MLHCGQARHLQIVAEQPDPPNLGYAKARQTSEPLGKEQIEHIQKADCIFIASHLRQEEAGGADSSFVGPDMSHRGGPPGFVEVLSPRKLQWPDYIGNYLFQTLGVSLPTI